jgi:AcrR family transcriptional regulator
MPVSARAKTANASKRTRRVRSQEAQARPRPRLRLEVDERRAQLVKLGLDLFAARSYDDVSIDELARAAGVSKGLLYHYFPTKRDFYVATVLLASRQFLELTATPDTVPPVERLRAGLDAYLDYVVAHAPAYASLLRGGIGSDAEVQVILDETRALLCERLLEGLPGVTPTPLVRIAMRGWLGFCEATSLDWIDRRSAPREAIRDLMLEVLLATVPAAVRGSPRGGP